MTSGRSRPRPSPLRPRSTTAAASVPSSPTNSARRRGVVRARRRRVDRWAFTVPVHDAPAGEVGAGHRVGERRADDLRDRHVGEPRAVHLGRVPAGLRRLHADELRHAARRDAGRGADPVRWDRVRDRVEPPRRRDVLRGQPARACSTTPPARRSCTRPTPRTPARSAARPQRARRRPRPERRPPAPQPPARGRRVRRRARRSSCRSSPSGGRR